MLQSRFPATRAWVRIRRIYVQTSKSKQQHGTRRRVFFFVESELECMTKQSRALRLHPLPLDPSVEGGLRFSFLAVHSTTSFKTATGAGSGARRSETPSRSSAMDNPPNANIHTIVKAQIVFLLSTLTEDNFDRNQIEIRSVCTFSSVPALSYGLQF